MKDSVEILIDFVQRYNSVTEGNGKIFITEKKTVVVKLSSMGNQQASDMHETFSNLHHGKTLLNCGSFLVVYFKKEQLEDMHLLSDKAYESFIHREKEFVHMLRVE